MAPRAARGSSLLTQKPQKRCSTLQIALIFLIGIAAGSVLLPALRTLQPAARHEPSSVTPPRATVALAAAVTPSATTAAAAATTARAVEREAAEPIASPPPPAPSDCPQPVRPYHTLLTASSGIYQEWQTRVFHYHYQRMKAADRCGEVGGFTRLLTQPAGARTDGLHGVMRTVVVAELTKGEDLGFVVLNRPHSVVEALKRGDLNFAEPFVLICETDHIFLKPDRLV